MSPSSSPRLPSPPPIAEDQISPKSPTVSVTEDQNSFYLNVDQASARRIRPGTKAENISDGPPLVELSQVSSNIRNFFSTESLIKYRIVLHRSNLRFSSLNI